MLIKQLDSSVALGKRVILYKQFFFDNHFRNCKSSIVVFKLHVIFRPDDVVVPCGTPAETGVTNPDGYTLNYNGRMP